MNHLRLQWVAARDGDRRPYLGYEMRYRQEDQGERKPRHIIECFDGSKLVGELNWYGTTGTIHHIGVEDGYMRQGIATAMWQWGQEMRPRPKHSGDRTTQGDAWARSVGGPIPRKAAVEVTYEYLPSIQRAMDLVTAMVGRRCVGRLYWHNRDAAEWIGPEAVGKIASVDVEPSYQRQGIATGMLRKAREVAGYPIVHSDALSDEGEAWARAVGSKTALPSWRPFQNDRTFWAEHDAVIATDKAGSRRTFEVWLDGLPFTRAPSLDEAKSRVEARLGPLVWKAERLPLETIDHRYFGPTTEFTDPVTIYWADRR